MIYFNPKCDVCVYQFAYFSWGMDFIADQCRFEHVEIIAANVSFDELASATGHGLRSTNFSARFPSLKRLVIRESEANLVGMILRNGWGEDRWKEEARLRQKSWDAEWTLMEKVFKKQGIELVTLQESPEVELKKYSWLASRHTTSQLRKQKAGKND